MNRRQLLGPTDMQGIVAGPDGLYGKPQTWRATALCGPGACGNAARLTSLAGLG